jgi:hypothetical protein
MKSDDFLFDVSALSLPEEPSFNFEEDTVSFGGVSLTSEALTVENDKSLVQYRNDDMDNQMSVDEPKNDMEYARRERAKIYGQPKAPLTLWAYYDSLVETHFDMNWVKESEYFLDHGLAFLSWKDSEKEHYHSYACLPFFTIFLAVVLTTFLLEDILKIGPLRDLAIADARAIIEDNQWWRLVTAPFFVYGILDWCVCVIGIALTLPALEQLHGSFRVVEI